LGAGQPHDTIGDFRLEITPEICLRDHMYALQQTTEWKDRYRIRAGIEATNSELKRAHGIGRLRVRRIAKVCLAVACKIIACNIKRWARAHMALARTFQGYTIRLLHNYPVSVFSCFSYCLLTCLCSTGA
jgi:hypothetical protein